MGLTDLLNGKLNSLQRSDSLPATSVAADVDVVKLGAWVKEQYQQMKNNRNKQQMIWYVNMAFYGGNQYTELIPRLNKLQVPAAPPYRVRHTSNRIKPIVRTEIARLTSQKPSASIIPASSDDEDLFAAYAGEQVWESIQSNSKLHAHWRRAVWWLCITGNGFLKTYWDPTVMDNDNGYQGDIKFGCVTPFHLFVPDLREEDIQEQVYVLNVYTRPVAWVKKFYGDRLNFNVQPNVVSAQEILNDAYLNLTSSVNNEPDSVLCMEMWVKDGGCEFLEGNMVVHVVADQVVTVEPMYNHGKYPFTHFGHIPTGTFYRESVINDLLPLQREYNRTRSQLIENKNRMARPQLLAQKGSVDPSRITNEPGLVIEYRGGMAPPTPMPLQPIPNYVTDELARNIQDMEDISGQHEVSKGGVPPGVTAATAISFLQEKDDSLLTHTYQDVEAGMEDIAKQSLQLVQQFWDSQRQVKVSGEDSFFDTLLLSGADLKNNTDVRMEGGSSLPTSKAAKQALLMDLMKMGFIDPNDGLKIMDIGGVQKLYQRIKVDEQQAQRENIRMKALNPSQIEEFKIKWQEQQEFELQMANTDPAIMEQQLAGGMPEQEMMPGMEQQSQLTPPGMPGPDPTTLDKETGEPLQMMPLVPVNTWDNHDVHIAVHNQYRKSQAFELLPEEVKQQFEMHVQQHQIALTQAMMEVSMFSGGGMPGMDMGGEEGAPGEEGPGEPPPGGGESGPPGMMGGM